MNTENVNFDGGDDIFNLNAESFVNPVKTKSNSIYSPQADEGRDGMYKALVRFLPFHSNPNNSKIQKFYVWVDDETSGNAFSVDCPSTVGKKSILKDTYWKLFNSQSASDKELAKKFSRAENFYSLVQIVKDPNKPELEGKIMVFKFGKKINDKIESQIKPEPGFGTPCNPYDLFEGKVFALHISKKMKWNNYDMCEFVGDRCALTLPGEAAPIKKNKEDMAKVLEWLKANSPDLTKYEYKEWNDETNDKVLRAIRNIIPDARLVDQILSSAGSDRPSGNASYTPSADNGARAESKAKAKQNIDDLYENTPEPAKAAPKKEAAASASTDMDDLYADL